MREALRLAPPAPFRGVTPLEDTLLKDGTYSVTKDQAILINVYACQRDPKVWGEDVSCIPRCLRLDVRLMRII